MATPTIGDLTTSVTFGENTVNATPQIIDSDITFTATSPDDTFTGGILKVSGLLSQDTVSVNNQGTAAGQIGFSGGNVTYGGVTIGSASGGTGANFTVTFNANATTAAIDALLQNLTYANSSDTPTAARSLSITVTNAAGSGDFDIQTGSASPFNGIDVGLDSRASFGDLDGDGDLDMMVGESTGTVLYYKNTGTASAPVFTAQTGAANPLNGQDLGSDTSPTLVDIDGDGDLDLVVGEKDGGFNFFKNTGTASAPVFALQSGASDPFTGINPSNYSAPSFGDLDGDGDLDMVTGTNGGTVLYYKNTGSATAPAFSQDTGGLAGIDVGSRSTPTLGDVDGDGDLDIVVGESTGTLKYLENIGTKTAPNFVERTGAANPFDGVDVGSWSNPTLVDIDKDGDLDLVAGESNGTLVYVKNNTSRVAINVTAENDAPVATDSSKSTGENSVLNGSVPAASDVDGTIASYALVSAAVKGSLTFNADGTYSFNPNGAFEGLSAGASEQVSFTYRAIDNSGAQSAPKTVTITVNGVNDAPVAQDSSKSTGENAVLNGSVPAASDVDGTIASYALVSDVAKGSLTFNADGTYSYNPNGAFESLNAGSSEQVTFTYRAMDNNGQSSSAKTVTITVNGANDAPVANDSAKTTNENTVLSSSVPAASDIDGTVAGYVRDANVAKGSLTFNADGTYSYNPNGAFASLGNGESETVTFTYHAVDNSGASSAVKTVTITVTGVNAAPEAHDGSDTVAEGVPLIGSLNVSDPDGTIASFVIDSQPAKGNVTIEGDAEYGYYYKFSQDSAFESLGYGESEDVAFTWHAVDNNGVASAVQTTTVTVTGVNDDATLSGVSTSITVTENAAPAIIDADVTVTDPEGNFDGGTLTVSGLLAEDIVSVNNQGTGAGQVGFSGGIVTYGGVAIGTAAGGEGATLVVTFNDSASKAAVEAVTENLTYANGSDSPTASRTLTVTVSDEIQAKTPILDAQTGADNPFAGIKHGDWNATAFGDLDGDGDLDLVAGGNDGLLHFYENTGSASSPSFSEVTGAGNPFAGIDVGGYSSPALVDLDGDGDLDLVAGAQDGTLSYFENTGSASAPVFTARTGAANPFDGINPGSVAAPAFADIDGDGDADLVAGGTVSGNLGGLSYFENTGSATTPAFTARTGDDNPFEGIRSAGTLAPSLGDVDKDGDIDLVVGTTFYGIKYVANLGSSVYAEQVDTANPFIGVVGGPVGPAVGEIHGQAFAPTLVDLDADGDLDVVAGGSNGSGFIGYAETTGIGKGSSATVTVNVTGVNDAPVASDDTGTTAEDTALTGAVPAATDVDGTIASYALVSSVAKGSLTLLEDGTWSFDPDGDFDGLGAGESEQVSFTYRATDNEGGQSAVKTVTITVTGVDEAGNAAPVASNDAKSTDEASVLDGSVPAASDADGTIAGYVLDSDVAKGELTFNSDGSYSFDPNGEFAALGAGDSEEVTFTYKAVDNDNAQSAAKTVTITVTGVNDAPALHDVTSPVTFAENTVNATPQLIDADVDLIDPEGNFDGGAVTVSGLLSEDVVSIRDQGTAAGEIGFSAGIVSFGGVAIGTATGGDGDTFTVTLDADATTEAVEALIQNLTYANTSDSPTHARTLTIGVTDGDGASTPVAPYTDQTGAANPFAGIDLGGYAAPAFADIDGDNDIDLIVGAHGSEIHAFENTGSGYVELTGADNPFGGIDIAGGYATPAFADIDGDSDLDLVVGSYAGEVHAFENTGAGYVELTGTDNPFDGINPGRFSAPAFGDFDGDGDLDLILGAIGGHVDYYENTGTANAPVFTERSGSDNPFDGVGIGNRSIPAVSDVDGDGDLDVLLGERDGELYYIENAGSAISPNFVRAYDGDSPFNAFTTGGSSYAAPVFADVDGDGDMDLAVGHDGEIRYIEKNPSTEVKIEVSAENDLPVAADSSKSTGEGAILNASVPAASDVDGAIDSYVLVSDAAKGALTFNDDGTYSFNPNGEFEALSSGDSEQVTFTYKAVDNDGAESAVKTVTITVNGVNDAPAAADQARSTDEDTAVGGTVVTSDIDGTVVGHALVSGVAKGSLTFLQDGSWSFDPDGDFDGLAAGESEQVTFTYRALDNDGGQSAVKTVTITVNGVDAGSVANVAPVATDGSASTGEGSVLTSSVPTAADSDGTVAGYALVTDVAKGDLSFNSDGTYSFNPDGKFEGLGTGDTEQVTFTYKAVDDDGAQSAAKTVTITVTGVNDLPVAGNSARSTGEDSVLQSAVPAAGDIDGTIASYALVSSVAKGSLTFLEDGSYSFDPNGKFDSLNAGQSEQVTFTYRATDNDGGQSDVKTVTITVNGADETGGTPNDVPEITSAIAFTVAENTTAVGTITATDGDDTPVYSIAGGADAFLFKIDATTGALSFKAAPDYEQPSDADGNNAYQVTVRASDGDAGDTEALTVTVTNEDGVTIKGTKKKDVVSEGATVKGQLLATGEEDTITGKGKNDKLHGAGGNDLIDGGKGKDKLFGDDGDDRLTGGKDNDKLTGGLGEDSFVFNAKLKANIDKVKDFEAGVDTIVLDDKVFKKLSPGPLSVEEFVTGNKAKDGDDHVIYNQKNGQLLYDRDGDGGHDAIAFAKIGKGLDLDAADFLVI